MYTVFIFLDLLFCC